MLKQIPSQILFENNYGLVIQDIHPQSVVHYLWLPKTHLENLLDDLAPTIMNQFMKSLKDMIDILKLNRGFKTTLNTGQDGGQEINHLHIHLQVGPFFKTGEN